jgi:hypothetical protein
MYLANPSDHPSWPGAVIARRGGRWKSASSPFQWRQKSRNCLTFVSLFPRHLRAAIKDRPIVKQLSDGTRRASFRVMRDDIQTRIAKLKKQIEEATGETPVFGTAPDCPPEIEEAFLEDVLKYELAEQKGRARRAAQS